MKIDDDFVQESESVISAPRRLDRALLGRAVLTLALAVMLVVALRWALNVTNANARQVSSSLTNLQEGMDRPGTEAFAERTQSDGKEIQETSGASAGPVLEPVDDPASRAGKKP